MAYLAMHSSEGVRRIDLGADKVSIGRHATNTLALEDELASRYHCEIEPTAEGYVLRDLDSRNGTVMEGLRVVRVVLRPGSEFFVGNTRLVFCDDTPPSQPLAPASQEQAAGSINPAALAAGDLGLLEPIELVGGADWEQEPEELRCGPTFGIDSIEALNTVGRDVPFDVASLALINARGQTVHAAADTADPTRQAAAEMIRLIRLLLMGCIRSGASDLHVEPRRSGGLVRLRIDGAMVQVTDLDAETTKRLVSLIKVLCDIDFTKKAIVQEGHFSAVVPGRRIDYRVSFTPSMFGQKLVLRVLDPANAPQRLRDLELPEWMFNNIRGVSRQDTGMLLVCGPTGSGKTTTLYAVLRQIDAKMRNVITIEDPIEYELPGLTQIPVDDEQGHSFNNLLRSVLRQDPDVIVLGEIRDRDTATTAMQAATTGHLVLSTVHAKDTIGAIFRLLDLGVEPYLVASTLNLVLAQRLVRKLCPYCRMAKKPTPQQIMRLGRPVEGVKCIYTPAGCPKCFGTGYAGRQGMFELLTATDELRDVVLKTPDIAGLKKAIELTMFVSLREAGVDLVHKGVTSMDEIDRVIGLE
jgi:general secretion pathway protein E